MTRANAGTLWLALRQRLGIDQSEFAEIALTSRSTISRLETGETELKYRNIRAIERHLGAPISVLLGDDTVPPAPDWYYDYTALPATDRRATETIIRAAINAFKERSQPPGLG